MGGIGLGPAEAVVLFALATFFGLALLVGGVSAVLAYQASQRGYSFFVWLIAGMLGNPVFLLILLGVLPDRAKRRQRAKELDDIRRRVNDIPLTVVPVNAAPPRLTTADIQRSMGDAETVLPDRSIGDAVTRLPERSIGDEPTRG